MNSLPLIASRLFNTPLMVHPQKAAALIDGLGGRILGCDVMVAGAEPLHHIASEQGRPSLGRLGNPLGRRLDENNVDGLYHVGATAVIPIEGSLLHKGKWLGASSGETSYEGIQARVRQAMDDPSVRGVVFEVDSFGGEVAGAFDTAALIRQLSAVKPTIAILTDYALSAGYLLASGARSIVMPASGRAGSIGVVTLHIDYSKMVERTGLKITVLSAGRHKAEGTPYEPLAPDVASRIRADLEQSRILFAQAVAAGRGDRMSVEAALATEADDFRGTDALALGLVDAVGHPNELFDEFVSNIKNGRVAGLSVMKELNMNQVARAAVSAAVQSFPAAQLDSAHGHKTGEAKASGQSSQVATSDLGMPIVAHRAATPDAREIAREAGLDALPKAASEMSKFEAGAAAARALLSPALVGAAEMSKFAEGAAAARALLGPIKDSPDEMAKYEAGASAARALLGPVAASASELLKFNEGAEAARRLLSKIVAPSAETAKFNEGAAAARALLGSNPHGA